jgi:TetR/AcrR family transcriptional repressor of nem operon
MEAIAELIWTGSYGSTTIDQICDKAGVKKGSFYYFFKSKADLAEAAIDVEWAKYRVVLDGVFSASVAPLQRIRAYCETEYQHQKELKKLHGYVLGCPLCTLGAEVSTQESGLRKKVEEIMRKARSYVETAIRDAQADKTVHVKDAADASRIVYAYMEGMLTQARIQNNVELLKEMAHGVFMILGVKEKSVATV